MHPKSKKKTIAIKVGLLAYTFTKFDDNLTDNDGDILDVKYVAISVSMPSGLNDHTDDDIIYCLKYI